MDDYRQITTELCDFISRSPSCYHVINNVEQLLEAAGFEKLREETYWYLSPGNSYYVTRNDSSLIAFSLPEGDVYNYQIIASHCDSPSFKIKENPEIPQDGGYIKLNVEKYG